LATSRDTHARELSDLEDLELIRLLQEEDHDQAAEALLRRHLPWLERVAARQGRRRGLSREEVEEVQVEAALAVVGALPDFRPERGCPLRAFLGAVIVNCVRAHARRVRSAERPYDRSPRAAGGGGGGAGDGPGALPRRWLADRRDRDSAALAERRERLAALEQVLAERGPLARRLWEGMVARRSLRALAPELGLTYRQARTLNRQLEVAILVRLRRFLN
jgi:RNA polymerase sigma factor (sigma-70 family)